MASQPIRGEVEVDCPMCGRTIEATPTASGVISTATCQCGHEVELTVNAAF